MNAHYGVQLADVTEVPSDLLLLKHAGTFFGVDRFVAGKLVAGGICTAEELDLQPGKHVVLQTNGVIKPARVMFLGTPPLGNFEYEQMRSFACQAIRLLARQAIPVRTLTTTVHGAGYGLDPAESLQNLLLGFEELHFDVARHRCIYYKSIRQLARDLEKLLRGLALSPA